MRSPVGRNAQHCSCVFGVSLGLLANVNKAAWSVYKYDSDVDVIFHLLLVNHSSYAHLPMFSSDEVDFEVELLCTKYA